MVAALALHRVSQVTPQGQFVDQFDIRDASHFVYRVAISDLESTVPSDAESSITVGTGRSLASLLVPDSVLSSRKANDSTAETAGLWAVEGGEPFAVARGGIPVTVSSDPTVGLALSPDGHEVVTTVPVREVPKVWETLYPPPSPNVVHRLHAGPQDLHSGMGTHRYARIELASGAVIELTEGPTGDDGGWTSASVASWSRDGRRIVLTSAYTGKESAGAQTPCIAVLDVKSDHRTCLWPLKAPGTQDCYMPWNVEFVEVDPRRITITCFKVQEIVMRMGFRKNGFGRWTEQPPQRPIEPKNTRIWIAEDLNHSPLLMAARGGESRVLWDPNPQLKDIELSKVLVYHWRDSFGRQWTGGLYQPQSYRAEERYPLVIQTHGFRQGEFNPSGVYTTANAAQALAGAGVFVLQVHDVQMCHEAEDAGKCAADGYDTAVKQLSEEGKIDETRVGLEGFSGTCLYVTASLALGATRYRAATLTDGTMLSYLEYLTSLDNGGLWPETSDQMLGPPFGANLTRWVRESPVFNLDRSKAAVQVIALGRESLLYMWEPYARLRLAHRPADIVLLNTSEHLLTNPKVRLASQGGEVDWFRYWLKGEEDPATERAPQYKRWRALQDWKPSNLPSIGSAN
jgi:hypothetical protein